MGPCLETHWGKTPDSRSQVLLWYDTVEVEMAILGDWDTPFGGPWALILATPLRAWRPSLAKGDPMGDLIDSMDEAGNSRDGGVA